MKVRLEPAPVRGFRFAGVCAGLRNEPGRKDLGLIVADRPARRPACSPPIASRRRRWWSRRSASGADGCRPSRPIRDRRIASPARPDSSSRAILRRRSRGRSAASPQLVAPCSTGVIGHLYDLEKYRARCHEAVAALAPDRFEDFARAIMTTDTHPKMASVRCQVARRRSHDRGLRQGRRDDPAEDGDDARVHRDRRRARAAALRGDAQARAAGQFQRDHGRRRHVDQRHAAADGERRGGESPLAGRDLATFEAGRGGGRARARAGTGARRRRRDQTGDDRGARRAHRRRGRSGRARRSPIRRWSRRRFSAAIRISAASRWPPARPASRSIRTARSECSAGIKIASARRAATSRRCRRRARK